jgi:putative ATP-dependent endonuclease of OLD family
VSAASSGERELLTYLFAIYVLNVRDALIIVDEPELHLHPKWQRTLLKLFVRLATSTGNRFLLATHSPTFVSPDSIQYVSRVFADQQKSRILRLDATILPQAKHLLNIVNSQNNERLFFADKVVLVEGLSDRIFFEAVLDRFGRSASSSVALEVIDVGGKGFFDAYVKVLDACQIEHAIVADLDYVEDVGSADIRSLFKTTARDIKSDVIDNARSMDGDALVAAIDRAQITGSWDQVGQIWDYIKSRRRQLRTDLTSHELSVLQRFLDGKRAENIYILSRGPLEAYLPVGHGRKDMDKLIALLARTDFWEDLPPAGKLELELFATALLERRSLPVAAADDAGTSPSVAPVE